jgi:hypothetical protein
VPRMSIPLVEVAAIVVRKFTMHARLPSGVLIERPAICPAKLARRAVHRRSPNAASGHFREVPYESPVDPLYYSL